MNLIVSQCRTTCRRSQQPTLNVSTQTYEPMSYWLVTSDSQSRITLSFHTTGHHVLSALLQTQIVHLEDAHSLLDEAVAAAMRNSKPVYISVCCNLAGEAHPSFAGKQASVDCPCCCLELSLVH